MDTACPPAARFTQSIYIQLIFLLVPFIVASASRFAFADELPPWTVTAMIVSTVGAFLVCE